MKMDLEEIDIQRNEETEMDESEIATNKNKKDWKLSFQDIPKPELEKKTKNKKILQYYDEQNQMVSELRDVEKELLMEEPEEDQEEKEKRQCGVQAAIYASFVVNILLFIGKIIALILSKGSDSILAIVVDSALDLLSGIIVFVTNRLVKKKQVYLYPAGKSRFEPIGLVIFSTMMFSLSLQVLIESIRTIADIKKYEMTYNLVSIILIGALIVPKIILWIYCRFVVGGNDSVLALAEDHFNDIITNSFGLAGFMLGSKLFQKYKDVRFKYIDPTFAGLLSLYIMRNWFFIGKENVELISGKTAPNSFLKKLTFIAFNHDKRITYIDTVRAYHLSKRYLVEIDIVLDKDIPLVESHEIGEALQNKIERLPEVERCWVHLDHEVDHRPEHKDLHTYDM